MKIMKSALLDIYMGAWFLHRKWSCSTNTLHSPLWETKNENGKWKMIMIFPYLQDHHDPTSDLEYTTGAPLPPTYQPYD